jgi:hypothetical protein
MKAQSLTQIVYKHLFPHPRPNDPTSFSQHLVRNLVPEVRTETAAFYGTLDTAEARYPGLDYSHGPHRMRLGRFPWHRRLFRAFDELGLTNQEIASLCRWEGTRWARERYEADEGVRVIDTTGMEIPAWVEPAKKPAVVLHTPVQTRQVLDAPIAAADLMVRHATAEVGPLGDVSDDDEPVLSVGINLNERLMAAVEAREQGASVHMDEQWEQWLKDAAEQGDLPGMSGRLAMGDRINVSNNGAAVTGPSRPGESAAPAASTTGTAI